MSIGAEIRRLERAAAALEPDERERGRLFEAIAACSERVLAALDGGPAWREPTHASPDSSAGASAGAGPDDVGNASELGLSEQGLPLEAALGLLEREVFAPGAQPSAAGHLAYIPSGGLYHAALADFLAAVSNKYSGLSFTGPGAVRLENRVVRFTADLLGYPATAGGHVASGGSLASLSAIATARDAHGIRSADVPRAVVYLTEQTHHCLPKALHLAGLGEAPIRTIAIDERCRMRPEALAAAISADRAAGLHPWLVIGTAGTTDTGAIDPLDAIATIAERERCWFHVDAAYGGYFLLTANGRSRLAGIERSDSAVLDPHKGLFLPWGAGILVVRDVHRLLATHRHAPTSEAPLGRYLQDAEHAGDDPTALSPADLSPELSRPFRALRIWLPLALLGLAPFRAALDEKLLLARTFHTRVQALGFEVGPEPELAIATFRWAPAGATLAKANAKNLRLVESLRKDGRIFLSSTTLDGRVTLRFAPLALRTHARTVDLALELLGEQAAKLVGPP